MSKNLLDNNISFKNYILKIRNKTYILIIERTKEQKNRIKRKFYSEKSPDQSIYTSFISSSGSGVYPDTPTSESSPLT